VLACALAGCGDSGGPNATTTTSAKQHREEEQIRHRRAEEFREDQEVEANLKRWAKEEEAEKAAASRQGRLPEPAPAATDSASGFTGKYRSRYEEDKVICGVFPEAQIAKEFHVPGAGPIEIAEAYAEGFYGQFEQAALRVAWRGSTPDQAQDCPASRKPRMGRHRPRVSRQPLSNTSAAVIARMSSASFTASRAHTA
jgi:hypothetical protein